MLAQVQSAFVVTNVALATSQFLDHMATCVLLMVPTRLKEQGGEGKRCSLNRWSLSLPKIQQQIADAWSCAPPLPHGIKFDQMDELLTKYAQNMCARFSLPVAPKLKHPWVTLELWAFISASGGI